MTKASYMALADFQDLWTNTLKPYIVGGFIAMLAGTHADAKNLVLADGTNIGQNTFILATAAGANSGVATLGADGKVPASQLPSFVDDVIDLIDIAATAPEHCAAGDKYYNSTSKKIFTATGTDTWGETGADPEGGKIYITTDDEKTFRWSGSTMAEISAGLALGETQGTAYEGSKGAANALAIQTHTSNTDIHVTTDNKAAWNAKYDKPVGGIPSTDMTEAVQTSLGKADTALQASDIAGKADKIDAEAFSAEESYSVGAYVTYDSKLWKCTTAHEGAWDSEDFTEVTNNIVVLDGSGNIKDSGKKEGDFATAAQGSKADSAIQGVKVNGTTVTPDGNKVVDIEMPERVTAAELATFVV